MNPGAEDGRELAWRAKSVPSAKVKNPTGTAEQYRRRYRAQHANLNESIEIGRAESDEECAHDYQHVSLLVGRANQLLVQVENPPGMLIAPLIQR